MKNIYNIDTSLKTIQIIRYIDAKKQNTGRKVFILIATS